MIIFFLFFDITLIIVEKFENSQLKRRQLYVGQGRIGLLVQVQIHSKEIQHIVTLTECEYLYKFTIYLLGI